MEVMLPHWLSLMTSSKRDEDLEAYNWTDLFEKSEDEDKKPDFFPLPTSFKPVVEQIHEKKTALHRSNLRRNRGKFPSLYSLRSTKKKFNQAAGGAAASGSFSNATSIVPEVVTDGGKSDGLSNNPETVLEVKDVGLVGPVGNSQNNDLGSNFDPFSNPNAVSTLMVPTVTQPQFNFQSVDLASSAKANDGFNYRPKNNGVNPYNYYPEAKKVALPEEKTDRSSGSSKLSSRSDNPYTGTGATPKKVLSTVEVPAMDSQDESLFGGGNY